MSPEELSRCEARGREVASRLRLPLRSRVWKGQAGEFQGAGVGSSLDFQDHRTYVPGDDPRHINWQAYARTGQYTMKLYREEVRPSIDLVIDVSESMFFEPDKAARSAELLYFLVASAGRSGASTSIHLVRGRASRLIDRETVVRHRWLDLSRELDDADPSAAPDLSRLALRPNAIRVLLSDLLFPGDPDPVLRQLAKRQGSPVLLAPFSPSEENPDWSGSCEFIDAEERTHHPHRIDPAVLRRFRENYANHFRLWKLAATKQNARFARVDAARRLDSALFAEALPAGALETHH